MNKCNICGNPADDPYRTYDEDMGYIKHGCVAPNHTPYIVFGTIHHTWHWSSEAVRIRENLASAAADALTGDLTFNELYSDD